MDNLQPRYPVQSRMLQVVSIIILISGFLSTVILSYALIQALNNGTQLSFIVINGFSGLLLLGASLLEIVAGILGIKSWHEPKRADACVILGFFTLLLIIAGIAANLLGNGSLSILNFGSMVLPILYMVAASQLKKQSGDPE